MYVPAHFKPDDDAVRELLGHIGAADLITATADGLLSTMLPLVHDEPGAGRASGRGARCWDTWRGTTGNGGRRPSARRWSSFAGRTRTSHRAWYETKREHGRVVPTWNYITAHAYGRLVIHDDPAWVEANVRRLTAQHEADRQPSWSVDDAPEAYIAGQLKAIVGVEIVIDRVQAKFKLSQNRSDADIAGAIEGLEERGEHRVRPPCAISGEVPTRPDPPGAPLQAAECAPVGDAAGDEDQGRRQSDRRGDPPQAALRVTDRDLDDHPPDPGDQQDDADGKDRAEDPLGPCRWRLRWTLAHRSLRGVRR